MEYRIQVIHFNGKKTHRILQNVGGPCPLLGLCNVLLLNNDIRVNQKISFIKFSDLTHCLKDHLHKLFEVNMGSKSDVDESQMANAIKNIEDCVALFPKLEQGLDINIKFSDVTDFEFTSALAMFDNYNIRLLHGWCVDPQDNALYDVIKDKSYNEVVDFLTSDLDSTENDAEIAKIEQQKANVRQFLNDYQQQLTAHGLFRLHEVMNENEIAIFFRNNHFSAVYKRQGQIWELVTDEGIVDADPRITWQSLSQLSGDEEFVSNKFALISQNINQQQQMESYNNLMRQQQQESEEKKQHPDGFSIQQQEAYLQQQYEETNAKHNKNDDKNEDNSADKVVNKQEAIDNNKASDDALNNEVAQRIALEQQLGLESGELERLQKEQKEAMKQIKIQQEQQQIYANQKRNDQFVYAQQYDNKYPNQQKTNTKRRRKKRRNIGSKGDDNCIIL